MRLCCVYGSKESLLLQPIQPSSHQFFIRLFLVFAEEGIFYELLPLGKRLMKPCNETLYNIFFQSHCLCSIKEVCQTKFCFLSRKSKCQFLLILGICYGNIEKVISWRQLIVLSRSVKREVFQVHVVIACDKTEEQQLHVIRKVEFWRVAVLRNCLGNLFVRSFVFVFRRVQRELTHILHVYLLAILSSVNTLCDVPKSPISQTNKTMRHNTNLCCFGKVHR